MAIVESTDGYVVGLNEECRAPLRRKCVNVGHCFKKGEVIRERVETRGVIEKGIAMASTKTLQLIKDVRDRSVASAVPHWDHVQGCVKPDMSIFPPCLTDDRIAASLQAFQECLSEENARERICAVCGGRTIMKNVMQHKWTYLAKKGLYQKHVEEILRSVPAFLRPAAWNYNRTYRDHGYLLEPSGQLRNADDDINAVLVCKQRDTAHDHGQMPPLAYSNGTWVGEDHDIFFNDMSLVEEYLVAKSLIRGSFVTLGTTGSVEQRQRALKGNIITFPVDVVSSSKALNEVEHLPRDLRDVFTMINVSFYGNFHKKQVVSVPSVQRLFQVRRNKVRIGLEILQMVNPWYKKVFLRWKFCMLFDDCLYAGVC